MVNNSLKQTKIHISRLTNSILATKTIEELTEEKLIVANEVILENQTNLSNEFLDEMCKQLKVDEIYWYNSHGEIIYTAGGFLGWQTRDGHTEYDFLKSDEKIFIEPIRADVESGIYYKYAYARANDGEFVQTGILADKIYKITEAFCPAELVNLLIDRENIVQAYYLENEEEDFLCQHIVDTHYNLNEFEKEAIAKNQPYYTKTKYKQTEVYETLFPIHIGNIKMGTLIVFHSLEGINKLIKQLTLITLSLLFLVFLLISYMAFKSNKKTNEIKKLAYYDALTGLANKNYFNLFVNERLQSIDRNKDALIIISFRNFHLVKLIYGSQKLDDLLMEKVKVIKKLNLKNSHLFAYSEDKLFIYIKNCKNIILLDQINDKIFAVLDTIPQTMESSELIIKRIGTLLIDSNYKTHEDIIKHIEITINKLEGLDDKDSWFFHKEIQGKLLRNELIEKELRATATHKNFADEFHLVYQPQLDLKTGKIIGLEALARWENKKLGYISPQKFIKIAEQNQLILPLGEWILKTACLFMKELHKQGFAQLKMAVNISVIQLLQDDFETRLQNIIMDTQINPAHLALEITETNFMNNYKIINQKLNSLRKLGVSISLDDFGTGYSSLARLKNLSIDTIKIDKSFIDNITQVTQKDIFIESILLLARQLNLKVVAEGVETLEQKEYLSKVNCDFMQGYLFSQPVTSDKALKIIRNTN